MLYPNTLVINPLPKCFSFSPAPLVLRIFALGFQLLHVRPLYIQPFLSIITIYSTIITIRLCYITVYD